MGSPEKQLTPAPQPRSAWVSARSEVVTAAHRAWQEGEGRVRPSPSGGQWDSVMQGRGRKRKEPPRSRAHPQSEREAREED